jgi:hypothetical protein
MFDHILIHRRLKKTKTVTNSKTQISAVIAQEKWHLQILQRVSQN